VTAPDGTQDALEAIARFAIHEAPGSLPAAVATQARRLLLDGISWMVMGAQKEEAQPLLATAARRDAPGSCSVIGSGRTTDLVSALFANTALAQVHDCSDGRRLARRDGGSNHPGRSVIPAALTLAQHWHLSGRELLQLVVIGYEVVSRARVRVPDMEYSLGVAAMISRVMGRDAGATQRALALAALTFPLRADRGLDDTDFDFLAQGCVARAAAVAALDADAARTLPPPGRDLQLASPFPPPGSSAPAGYELLDVYIKPYPCCRALHGAIDLALELRALGEFTPADIAHVEVRTGNRKAYLFDAVGPDATYKRCQFSIPYATACALLDGAVSEASFTEDRIAAQDVRDLQARVRCTFDESLEFNPNGFAAHFRPSVLTLTTRQGRTWTRETTAPRGSVLNPLTEDALLAKFRAWTGPGLSDAAREQAVALVQDLERVDDAARLVELLGGD
jgi:2-methylcitrate dehydratase PrpD